MADLRPATYDDAAFLVPLYTESSGGVWPAVWNCLRKDGQTLHQSALAYLQDSNNDLSVNNTIICQSDDARLAAITSYQETDSDNKPSTTQAQFSLPDDLEQALQPYQQLRDTQSLFIAELCCLPEARGQGLGSSLINHAKQKAITMNLPRVSLRVFGANVGAVKLYKREGFSIVDQRAVIPHADIKIEGEVLLMACPV